MITTEAVAGFYKGLFSVCIQQRSEASSERDCVHATQMYKSNFSLDTEQFVVLVREVTESKNLQVLHLNPSFPDVCTKQVPTVCLDRWFLSEVLNLCMDL